MKYLDNKAFIFSIDTLFAILIITILIGLSTNILETTQSQKTNPYTYSVQEKYTYEAADILINTNGQPDHWYNTTNTNIIPGLSSKTNNTTKNLISFEKILKLQKNYDH